MTTEHKAFGAQIKAVSTEKGEVTAVVSVFGNIDSYGDRMVKGAFASTLAEWKASGNPIPFVWSHEWDDPESFIGQVTAAEETDEGLLVTAKVDLDRPFAEQVFHLLKTRRVTQFSFGYLARAYTFVEDPTHGMVRELTDVQLLEVGPTMLGANQATRLIEAASAFARDAKAGRVLSSKNEDALKQAHSLLSAVLDQVAKDSDEPKSAPALAEPETVTEPVADTQDSIADDIHDEAMDLVVGDTPPTIDQERLTRLLTMTRHEER